MLSCCPFNSITKVWLDEILEHPTVHIIRNFQSRINWLNLVGISTLIFISIHLLSNHQRMVLTGGFLFFFFLFALFGGRVGIYWSVQARGVRFDTSSLWFSFYASGSLWGFWLSQRPATHAEPLISTAMREHGDWRYAISYFITKFSWTGSISETRVTDTCQSTNLGGCQVKKDLSTTSWSYWSLQKDNDLCGCVFVLCLFPSMKTDLLSFIFSFFLSFFLFYFFLLC